MKIFFINTVYVQLIQVRHEFKKACLNIRVAMQTGYIIKHLWTIQLVYMK